MKERFMTKDGGRVAVAEEGEFEVGANPFGFACADCGRVHAIRWDADKRGHLVLKVSPDDAETLRFREYLGVPSDTAELSRQFLEMQEYLGGILEVVVPQGEKIAQSLIGKAQQLARVIGRDRRILADWSVTGAVVVEGVTAARKGLKNASVLLNINGQADLASAAIHAADIVLAGILPQEEKKEKGKVILLDRG